MMNYNIVTIDPSIISTAVCVSGKLFNYCRESDVFLKSGRYTKWFDLCKEHVTYRFITINKEKISYSEGEILKLKEYSASVDLIISDIKVNINPELSTKIGIEGFSYSSMIGPLIDLVTFSTLLRSRLYNEISKDITVLSPMSLKLEACKLTYPAINIGKKKEKLEWRNKLGIAGGSFN